MSFPQNMRFRFVLAVLTLTLGFLSFPQTVKAEILINDLNSGFTTSASQDARHIAPASAFCPYGSSAEEATCKADVTDLLALLGVCVVPPVDPNGGGSGNGNSGNGGNGGGTTTGNNGGGTSTGNNGGGGPPISGAGGSAPEPGSIVIGLTGIGLVGLVRLTRRRFAFEA